MSELSQISTLNTTQDINKQLAYIRSYLIQLKDEVESELNNVTYNMLSPDLRKRIDMINDDIVVQGEDKQNGSLVLDSLICNYASISRLVNTFGEIQTLTSQLATITKLAVETTVSAEEVLGNIIRATGSITSPSATISGKITCGSESVTGTLKCGTLDCNNFTAPGMDITEDGVEIPTLSADSISPTNGKTLTISGGPDGQGEMTMGTIRTNSLNINNGGSYRHVTTHQVPDKDGNIVTVLGL